jgi:hypothetical protein
LDPRAAARARLHPAADPLTPSKRDWAYQLQRTPIAHLRPGVAIPIGSAQRDRRIGE